MLTTVDTTQVEIPSSLAKVKPEETRRMKIWLDERIAASKKKPSVEIVTLTPALAALILEHNPKNRPISKRNSDELKQDMANGRFVFNGEGIIISDSGILNDGQHRCRAVIETGSAIQTVICFGPREDTRFTVDTGRSKSVANFLDMKGKLYTRALGAAAAYVLEYRQHGALMQFGSANRPSKAAVLAAVDELRGLEGSVTFTSGAMKTVRSHAVVAFSHFILAKRAGREAADDFIQKLIEGDGLRRGEPIHFCRNRLLSYGRATDARARAELIFKCWNAWRTGTTIQLFRASSGKYPALER